MDELVNSFSAVGLLELLCTSIAVFIPTMAVVYLFGKMLGIVRTPRIKNFIAFISDLLFSFFYDFCINGKWTCVDYKRIWSLVLIIGFVILIYVLVGFRLFTRVDSLLDKKIGEDNIDPDIYIVHLKKDNSKNKNKKIKK